MQADARFVQNVQHADQRRANLRGQPDALGLAAAQRAALAIQREIAEADIFQKAEPGADFLDDFGGDFLLELRQRERGKKLIGFFHRQRANIHDGQAGDFYFRFFALNSEVKPSPPRVTARISGFSRLPLQTSQNCGPCRP